MSSPLAVSIMIPTYNQEEYIIKAVESAVKQDYPNLQIVVADDCSTDRTGEILLPYIHNNKIRYIKNKQNLGRVANYKNCLYNNINTEWVINLDGDDYYTNNSYISQAMASIEKYGFENVLFYQGLHCFKNGEIQDFRLLGGANIILTGKDYFLRFNQIRRFSHMSTVYNRILAMKSGFYEVDVLSTDIFSVLKMCINNGEKKVILTNNISGVWFQHNNNASKKISTYVHYKNAGIFKKLFKYALAANLDKYTCYKWLTKSTYIYFRSYIGLIYRKFKKI